MRPASDREVLGAAKEEPVSAAKTNSQSTHVTKSAISKTPKPTKGAVAPATAPTSDPAVPAAPPSSAAATPAPGAPLQARITGAIALVNQAIAMVAIASSPLSPAQVKARTKFRKGGEEQIPVLVQISAEYGVEVPSRPTSDMEANLAQAQALVPLVTVVARFLTLLESVSFEVRSEAWATATTLYQMLRKAAVRQPALKADLAPLEQFFAYRHPLVVETAPKTQAQVAKETRRQENAAKKRKRLQDAAAAAAATPPPAPNPTPPAAPATPVTPATPHA